MIIPTNISKNSYEKIKELISKGKYSSIPEFVQISVENQIYLEKQGESEGKETIIKEKVFVEEKPEAAEVPPFSGTYSDLLSRKECSPVAVSEPHEEKINTGWLWGQYNKIFPAKLSLRMLANMATRSNDGYINLEEAQEKIAVAAREIGQKLKAADKRVERIHGEKFSAGLPTSEKEHKALSRYKAQFVGYMTKEGSLQGALSDLKFVNMIKDEKGRAKIGITKQGLDFALLKNPIIDEAKYSDVLFKEEKEFYLNHVSLSVKGEAGAIKLILNLIKANTNTPEDLNKKIAETEEARKKGWSDAVTNTMRAGVIGRLYDLGLIRKKKEGVYVRYELTKEGEKHA